MERITAQGISSDLDNSFNIYYTGNVYMGSNQEVIPVVYDTGSDWLLLQVHTCITCGETVYNYEDEATTSFSLVVPEETDTVIFGMGSTWITGFAATDRVCLTDEV